MLQRKSPQDVSAPLQKWREEEDPSHLLIAIYLTKWMNSIKVTQNASPSKHFSDKDKVLLVLYCSQFRKLLIFIWNA